MREIPWIGKGQWLKADTHLHTKLSDGAHSVSEVADQAARFGCQAIAITDHGDRNLSAATPEYARAIQAARDSHPNLLILAGLEWNVPPWGGDEHATLLVPPGPDEWRILAEFKERFDDWGRPSHDPALADQALRWLAERTGGNSVSPLIHWNHPSLKRETSTEIVADLKRLRSVSDLVIGFAGAPGHQRGAPLGDYTGKVQLIDRWDPAAARPNDAWDVLLRDGLDVWAAHAASDLHQAGPAGKQDHWPGEFSETWLYAPERSAAGVLMALRAGCFFAAHGHLVREVELTVEAPGLPRPAHAGEVIEAQPGTTVAVSVRFTTPAVDWQQQPNRLDSVELIAITAEGAKIAAQRPPRDLGAALVEQIEVPGGGLVVRARGRRRVEGEPALMFYTNPIRIITQQRTAGNGAGAAIGRGDRLPGPAVMTAAAYSLPMIAWEGILVGAVVGAVYLVARRGLLRTELSGGCAPGKSPSWPRRRYLLLFVLSSAVAVWGSVVPLRFEETGFTDAVARFKEILSGPVGLPSRSDFVANVLLFVPISGFLLGGLAADRRRRVATALCVPATLLVCSLLGAALEFVQLWLPDRTSSKSDVLAQLIGSVGGVVLWLTTGPAVTDWLRSYSRSQRPKDQVSWLLQAYCLGLLVYCLLPFDFTISPAELVHKYRQGKIQLAPFGDVSLSIASLFDLLLDGAVFVPVGMLVATWLTPARRPVRSLGASILIGAFLVLALEAAQLPIYSRFSSATDVIAGTVGVAVGAALMRRWRGGGNVLPLEPGASRAAWRAGLWLALAAGYSLLLVVVFCAPFEPILRDTAQIKARFEGFLALPFAGYYRGSPFNALFDILRKLVYFAPLGALLALAGGALPVPRPIRRIFLALMLVVAVGVGTSMEMIQVFLPPNVPDVTDVILYTTGAALGMIVTARVARARHCGSSNGAREKRP